MISFLCILVCLYASVSHALLTKPLSSLSLNADIMRRSKSALAMSTTSAPAAAGQQPKFNFGINGFGRIGRLVTRVMVNEPRADLKAINTGAEAKYMAYQVGPLWSCYLF
jgi:hypothetical protein